MICTDKLMGMYAAAAFIAVGLVSFQLGRITAPSPDPIPKEIRMPSPVPYVYPAEVLSVHDGDSMRVNLDLGFNTYRRVDLRLAGLDTPEVTGSSKTAGIAVRDFVVRATQRAREITVESTELDKYGRSLAVVYIDGRNLNKFLIDNGLALPYSGEGSRAGTWTEAKLKAAWTAAENMK